MASNRLSAATFTDHRTDASQSTGDEPALELVHNGVGRSNKPDLLFVHGISAGAWMWQDATLGYFGDAGYRAWALSLSGHAGSGDASEVHAFTLDHFADDLAHALEAVERPCVVIAHSLGGAVTQKFLARGGKTAGTVLVCSVPPYGLWRASMEMFWTDPFLWHEMGVYSFQGLARTNLETVRRGLFPSGIDDARFEQLASRLQDESLPAMIGALGWPPLAPPPLSQARIMVIGGAEDRFVPPTDVRMTAAWYGVEPHIIEKAGHMLMYESAGRDAADLILGWLDDQNPAILAA